VSYQNKAVVYDLLLKTAIGLTAVLHTWGSALTHL
jgi:hypothetical protein